MDRLLVSKTMKALIGECAISWGGSYENMTILSGQDKPSEADFTAKYNELAGIESPELRELRVERNRRIAETDWTQNRDVTLANDADWQTYRQALRDITDTYTSLDDVVWPEKP